MSPAGDWGSGPRGARRGPKLAVPRSARGAAQLRRGSLRRSATLRSTCAKTARGRGGRARALWLTAGRQLGASDAGRFFAEELRFGIAWPAGVCRKRAQKTRRHRRASRIERSSNRGARYITGRRGGCARHRLAVEPNDGARRDARSFLSGPPKSRLGEGAFSAGRHAKSWPELGADCDTGLPGFSSMLAC